MIRESLLAFTLITGANLGDAITTRQAISIGGQEQNPIYGRHAERLVPIKLLTCAVETGIFLELHRHEKTKTAAWFWVGGVVLVNIAATYQNMHQARIQRSNNATGR